MLFRSEITKIGIVFNDDGTTSFFAELEKSSAKQRERIEKAIEEKRTEKKKEEKKAEKEIQSYSKSNTDTKRTNVQADSMEELFEKMSKIDWDVVKSEKMPESGGKFGDGEQGDSRAICRNALNRSKPASTLCRR